MKTAYEILSLILEPFLPDHVSRRRNTVRSLVSQMEKPIRILDVGGRKSPYTIGVEAVVDILDLPRQTDIQNRLGLGFTDELINRTKGRRTNLKAFYIENFIETQLPDNTYDLLIATEVIEHVPKADAFVAQASRVLKKGGFFYVTVPNRITRPIPDPDHVKHYTADEMGQLLRQHFFPVTTGYYDIETPYRRRGMEQIYKKNPFKRIDGIRANIASRIINKRTPALPANTTGVFGIARKQ